MARTVNEKEYAEKRDEILDAVKRLVITKGYEQMTIKDILDDLGISKGAFYHYFDSKPALLEALIERMLDEMEHLLISVVKDPHLSSMEKFQLFFDTINRWKTGQKTFFLALLRIWYADSNAIVRQKLLGAGSQRYTPLLTEIIRQGCREGVLNTPYPDEVGEVVWCLVQGLSESVSRFILSYSLTYENLPQIEQIIAVYTDAIERTLGTPKHSLQLVRSDTLKQWIASIEENGMAHS